MPNRVAIVVDDERAIRRYISTVLQRAQFQAVEAESGIDGLRLVRELGGEVDLIVSDIQMPKGDGLSFARDVRAAFAVIPIVLVSGLTTSAAECDAFVEKPFSPRELLEAVRKALAARRSVVAVSDRVA